MKFLTIVETIPNQPPPTPEHMQKLGAYIQKSLQTGIVVMTGGLVRPTKGVRAERSEDGKMTFTDGPYAESKEFIDGYAILEAPDLEAAKKITAEFMAVAGMKMIEILPMFDFGGPPPDKR